MNMLAQREGLAESDLTQPQLPACRFCAAPLRDTFVDLGMSPLCESYLRHDQLNRDGAVLSAARARLPRAASWSSSKRTSAPKTSSPSTPTSPPTRTAGSSTRAGTPSWHRAASASTQPQLRRRAGQQRRLPAPALRRARHPGAGHRARARTSPRPPSEKGVPTLVEFFGVEIAPGGLSRERGRADLIIGNNVLAQVPDLNDFVGGIQLAARRNGTVHARVPTPAAADRRQPVRHDLPRALLVLLAATRPSGSSPPTV